MANKKINVILSVYPNGQSGVLSPTKLKIGSWTDEQKQDFLKFVQEFHPLADGHYYNTCSFNVHFDKSMIHARGFDTPKVFQPMRSQNKPNEIIIEIITNEEYRECWPVCPATCPLCMRDGQCTSSFIKKYVGNPLFPNKYEKQK
ncbi:MAG: hypothetical protein J5742_00505 [Alphaproteobacteria bacterium]|nr:hypothetical protein [Alphaproteobacteria bacterium]